MYIKNKKLTLVFLIVLILGMFFPVSGEEEFNFTTENGLRIRLIKTPKIGYITAHLLIHFENDESPAVPFLTVINIFEQTLTESKNEIFEILHKLGNDFELKYGYDHIILKINILPEQITLFASFLRKFYKFSFSNLNKFDRSKKQLLTMFKKKKNWEKSMATQIAYKYIFKDHSLGKSFFFDESLEKLNIVKVRSFFKRHLTPQNSQLIMKGDINPYLSADIIKKGIRDIKSPDTRQIYPVSISKKLSKWESQIFLYNADNSEPIIFRFKPGIYNKNLLFEDITNEMLFGHKTGIILSQRIQQRYALTNIKKDILKHKDYYVFCNSFKIDYPDMSGFIKLLQNPRNFLKKTKYSRLELIQTMNYMKKAAMIQNSFMDQDLTRYVYANFVNLPQEKKFSLNLPQPAEVLNYIGLGARKTEDLKNIQKPVIVIIGDQEKIFKSNPALRGIIKIIRVNNYFE